MTDYLFGFPVRVVDSLPKIGDIVLGTYRDIKPLLTRLDLTWHIIYDDEAEQIFNKEKFKVFNFFRTEEYNSCIIDIADDGEFTRLEQYWCNPFIWSPLNE